MDERQSRLLSAIIDQFIETALPVGSKRLLMTGEFVVSSATLRAEMGRLEDGGFLVQPHVSAGRVPTAKGYRVYVKEFMEPSVHEKTVRQKFDALKDQYLNRKDQERVYEAVALLSHMIPNIAFATVPHKERIYYLGLANALRQPEFRSNPLLLSGVVEVLEASLSDLLMELPIEDSISYFIGDAHILREIQSCSLMVMAYRLRGFKGFMGIMGPMRMDYAYNTVALELVADLLNAS